MKHIKILLLAVFVLVTTTSINAEAKIINANVKTKQIPAGTRLKINLIDPIGAPSSQEGELFTAMLVDDQKVDGIVLLPKGSMIRGNITKVVPNKRISRTAILYINLDHIVTPVGKQMPISAGLSYPTDLTVDGGIRNGGNYGYALKQNGKKAGQMVVNATKWGVESGDVSKYFYTPAAALFSSIGAGFYVVFDSIFDIARKGNTVVLHQGGTLNIMMLKPIDIPIS